MFHVEQNIDNYIEYLFEYNKDVNLVSRKMTVEDIKVLIKESFLLDKYIGDSDVVADVGSGNGLLGLPLSFSRKNSFTLIEPLKKKTGFLDSYKEKFKKDNVKVFTGKLEQFRNINDIDTIIARGFPYNKIFAEYLVDGLISKVVLITSKNKFRDLQELGYKQLLFSVEEIPWRDNLIILKMENVSRGTK